MVLRLNLGRGEEGQNLALMAQTGLTAYSTHVAPLVKGFARLTEVKCASIGANGLYDADPAFVAADVPGSGSGGEFHPSQIALAVTLDTATRGARGRGRFYLPMPAAALSTADGLISAVQAQSIATSCSAFLGALNGPAGFGNVSVVSTYGGVAPVTNVRVGRVMDTVRSRRRQMNEVYGAKVGVAQS